MMGTGFSSKIALIASLTAVLCFPGCGSKTKNEANLQSSKADRLPVTAIERDGLFYKLVALDSTTVFDLTLKNYPVDYDKTANGYFVLAINHLCQEKDYYWVYSVNDTMGQVAANNRKIGPGDTIVWHYRLIKR